MPFRKRRPHVVSSDKKRNDMQYEPKDPLLRIAEVRKLTRRSTSRIYADMSAGIFPRPIRIGARAVAWRQSEVSTWLDQRVAERDQREAA